MTDEQLDAVRNVASEIVDERKEQHAKWAQQDHPDGSGEGVLERLAAATTNPGSNTASAARALCQSAFANGRGTWALIAWEEFAEALDEDDPARLRMELVQCAAVFAAWIEAIDRRTKAG